MPSPVFSKKVIEQFGYDVNQYRDDTGEIGIDILPEKGLVVGIRLQGVSLLDGICSKEDFEHNTHCLLYTSPSPRDLSTSRMPSSA